MSSQPDFNPLLWFVCKICRQAFPDTDKLKKHKIQKHAEDCKNVKCIVFEEWLFDKQWIPSDNYFPESNSEFTSENTIEVTPLRLNCACHCHSSSAAPLDTQTERYLQPPNHQPNPYVLVKRLTSEELNAALNRNAEKPIVQSSDGSVETERTNRNRCLNSKDVQSRNETEDFSKHQEDQDQPQDLYADQNILVSTPELVQNAVAPIVDLNIGVSPDDRLGTMRSCTPPLCSQNIANVQNPGEKESEEAISFKLLEGEIHIELLSVTKEMQSSTEPPEPANSLVSKAKGHERSPVSAHEQILKETHSPSNPLRHNPYALVRRLTFQELNAALNPNSEKIIAESVPRSKGRKRASRFKNDDDPSPIKKKSYLQHQDQQQEFHAGENLSVFTPEVMKEIVTPKAEPSTDVFPEQEQFSSISTWSDPSVNAPSDIKFDADKQDLEENDIKLPTGTQTSGYQNQRIEGYENKVNKNIWCTRSDPNSTDTSTVALSSLFDFSNLKRTHVNGENKISLSKNNSTEQIPIINEVYSQVSVIEDICPSDSECFEIENPASPELYDEFVLVEKRHLTTHVASGVGVGIGIADNGIQLTPVNDTNNAQFEGQQYSNVELNENTICASSSAWPILFSSVIDTSSREPGPLNTSEREQPRHSTRGSRKKPQINYSESHVCSDCNLDFDTVDDLQDHQKLCSKHNRVDSGNRRDKSSCEAWPISSSTNSIKVTKSPSTVTDDDSDYAAAGDQDASESESDHCVKPANHTKLPRAKLWKRKTLSGLSPATVPQNRQHSHLIETTKERNLALFEWLNNQKGVCFPDGSTNYICFSAPSFSTAQGFGARNFIKCELCKIKLKTELHLINHVKNCWLHNQRNHCYCIPCDKSFANPQSLAYHFQENKKLVKHLRFQRKNGPHKLQSSGDEVDLDEDDYQRQVPVNDSDPHATAPVSSDKGLSLLQWLKIQHKNPNNVVALELDPFKSKSNKSTATTPTFTVSESSPIRCKLCLQLLTSDNLLRNHVETCWTQNKAKHRYCVPCQKYFKSPPSLKSHQLSKHKNDYPTCKQKSPWFCIVCRKDMESKLLFDAHQESLQIFLGNSSQTESIDFLSKGMSNVNSTQGQYVDIPDLKVTMKNLSQWLKHIRKVPNSDGTANLVLLDPEPKAHSSGDLDKDSDEIEINEDNPITCRLCLKKLTQVEDVKNHVKMCWSQNKENHRYCLSCDKGFATPTELQEHRASEHSAPKNIILFYREADGDQSLLSVDGLEVNSENPVTCKLCGAELVSTVEVKIHGENCWFHNKSAHIYCTICDRRLETQHKLRCHNYNMHRNLRSCGSVEDNIESETETEKLLPLGQWLKIQKENPNNVIALEPDPLVSETAPESSPVKCKLCQQLLTTESALRQHIRTCWIQNKAKHSYCIPCNQNFTANRNLVTHNKAKHPKRPTIFPTCFECSNEFLTESELAKHAISLQEFLKQRKHCTKTAENVDLVNTTGGQVTMSYLFEWLNHLRQIRNIDGTENIILVDPEPASDNFDEFNSKNPITCRLCQQKFTTVRALKFHVRHCWTQKKENHRFCVICEKIFEKPQNLQDHSRIEHLEVARASFKCKFCGQAFFDVKIFKEHQEAHKDPKFLGFKCTHCSVALNNKKDLSKHVAALHGRQMVAAYKCKICLKSFTAGNLLDNHNRSVHTGERPFKCKFSNCSSAYPNTGKRQLHYHSKHREELGLNPKQFLCSNCGKSFTKRMGLTRHLRISHTQIKPYKCTHEGCTKDFKMKIALTEHMRGHTGEKPYQCEKCGKSFAREWTFRKHKRSHEGTLNRAQCHLCPRKFLGGWELKQHLKIHQEQNVFKCQFCQVQCATRSYMKKHEKTHENEPDSGSNDEGESSLDSDV